MNVLLLTLCLGATTDQYSASDKALANNLIRTGLTIEQTALENLCKNAPNVIYALKDVSLQLEILDERETRYIFAKREEITSDIRIIAGRFKVLENVPLIGEVTHSLPSRDVCKQNIDFNAAFQKTLETRMRLETDRADEFQSAILLNKEHYRFWDNCRDVQCEFYYVSVRRTALAKVIESIGIENIHAGKLPAAVPLELFVEK